MHEIVDGSRHAVGTWPRKGPDGDVALVWVPDGGESVGDHPLSVANHGRYGWELIGGSEYHGDHAGPRSKYGRAVKNFDAYIRTHARGE